MEVQNPALIKRNFFNGPIADIYRALDGNSVVGAFSLTFCLIDQLAWLEYGNQHSRYPDWIKKRLLPNNIFYTNKEKELYRVRCGIIHTYGPNTGETVDYDLMACAPGSHLQRINNNSLKICLYSLLTETVYAAHLIFEEFGPLIPVEPLLRLKQQLRRRDTPQLYRDMHPALGIFDKYDSIELNHVKSGYSHHVLWKA